MSDSKDELIRMFFDEEAILFGRFILTSGKESNYYINVKKLSTKPRALKLIAKLMAGEAQKRGITFDRVAGPELGAVPIATALALETEKPLVIVRKKPKGHGTGSQLEGEVKAGDKVLLVEDVTTTGGSVLRAAEVLEREGAEIAAIMVVVDREEGAEETIGAKYTFLPLVRVSELFARRKEPQKE
ncbi:orotate phosphoribosyltransferase [Thermococcus kodakarensis KOD1]|uniref:Orotate phosphoribosyltransferase n=1 Tax=Thermococcus kodakarensis (strain ATCC BAA-918 / JCM 12380 / KOD1) TaxID=69014 RepID=PYRE_THEKO|nr:orotate phosphoribosyltransferase [Thermococcus kodakarensis]Q5JHF4.1 RecName: Full=Orotate phosphoribosyltransferase; Short=OPRT; Short=OPRTase [Thermococcus kodakarensis KOD1]WCN27984.1 orotate phosphoribosyltransferase [Thermococcus kodakarensis]WCN30283.1 orotate phosphoribosyltransferase [Thermococcus kodakarensis]BAD86327.1 orotate phosphoribosyltransferase [Thermococcus kodakarensis KOD1]